MAQKDVMRAAEPSAAWFGYMLGHEKACKQTAAAYLSTVVPMSLFSVIVFVFRIIEAELEKSAAEQISSRTFSKAYSRAVMTASGTDRFSIHNRFEVLYLVCV